MYRFVLVCLLSAAVHTLWGQARLQLSVTSLSFGDVPVYTEAVRTLKVYNKGNKPLIIFNAQGSTGQIIVNHTSQPVFPGDSTVVQVRVVAEQAGAFSGNITITSNSAAANSTIPVDWRVTEPVKPSYSTSGYGIRIFPSPINRHNNLFIDFEALSPANIGVKDIFGRDAMLQTEQNSPFLLPTSILHSGWYLLYFYAPDGRMEVQRVMVRD